MSQNAELYDAVAAAKYGRALATAALASPVVIWTFGLWLFHSQPGRFMAATVEDGPVEWAQVALIVLGAVLAGTVAIRLLQARARRWAIVYLAVTLALGLIAGEEVSWGQRIVGMGTPRWLAVRNLQGEMNLHNLPHVMGVVGGLLSASVFFAIAGGIALWRRSAAEQAAWRIYLWAPQPALTLAWLSLFGYVVYSTALRTTTMPPGMIRRLQEVAELVLIVGGVFFLVSALRGARALATGPRLSTPLLYAAGLEVMDQRPSGVASTAGPPVSRTLLAVVLGLTALAAVGGWMFAAVGVPAKSSAAGTTSPAGVPQQLPGWMFGTGGGSEASLQEMAVEGAVRVQITRAARDVPGDIQLSRLGLAIEAQRPYRLEFRARATSARAAFVAITQNHPPWGDLGLYQRVNLTTAWAPFRFDFTGKESDSNARISFDLGGGPTVDIADVTVRRGPAWEVVPLALPAPNR